MLKVMRELRSLGWVRWRQAPRLLQATLLRYRWPTLCIGNLLTCCHRSGLERTIDRGCMIMVYTRRLSLRLSGGWKASLYAC